MNITVSYPTSEDYAQFTEIGMSSSVLDGCLKLVCNEGGHTALSFMKQEIFDRLGLDYLNAHATLEYSKFCGQWFMTCSEDDWFNDQSRNPDTEIVLTFDGVEDGTGREVYRDADGRYYLREVSSREPFAKWYRCGKRRRTDDGDDTRPNTIFKFKDQTEKVVYHDWNGTAAYGEQFNPRFRAATR